MPIIEEDGGRLNAFAKEPQIEVVQEESSYSKTSLIIIFVGIVILVGLIRVSINIS